MCGIQITEEYFVAQGCPANLTPKIYCYAKFTVETVFLRDYEWRGVGQWNISDVQM
jgi:hypothetical protein